MRGELCVKCGREESSILHDLAPNASVKGAHSFVAPKKKSLLDLSEEGPLMRLAEPPHRVPIEPQMVDVNNPSVVHVLVEDDKVWVNVDGVCLFRAQCMKPKSMQIVVEDNRSE